MTELRQLTPDERISWLQLARSEGIGPITFKRLLQRFGTADAAIAALPELARRGGRTKPPRTPSRQQMLAEIESLAALGGRHVALCEPDYPPYLRETADAPALLCVSGNEELLTREAVAIVGARNASAHGRKFARMLAAALGKAGYLVVSGLARGIDTAAHEASLDHQTAAVVAGGIDYMYPPENAALQQEIAARQLLLSEMPPGTVPKAEHFPRRNRIIAGMSLATIVVEAALRSGSLITARLANELGREVFAVPGSPLDPRSEGCNKLIRDGATLVSAVDDVLEAVASRPAIGARAPQQGFSFEELEAEPHAPLELRPGLVQHVLDLLSHAPIHTDELLREAKVGPQEIASTLLELEVSGRILRDTRGQISLIPR